MSISESPPSDASPQCITVRPDREIMTRQRLPYFVGISGATAGTKGLSMHLVVIPPGGAAAPHRYRAFETAIHVLEGRVETRYGPGLARSVVNVAGDFLFIPPDLPHRAGAGDRRARGDGPQDQARSGRTSASGPCSG